MSKPILSVIQQAMHAHDGDAEHWLEKVVALRQQPESMPHHKALTIVQFYLEELITSNKSPRGAEPFLPPESGPEAP